MRQYKQYAAGAGVATELPSIDFETASDAGFRFIPELRRWKSLPGLAEQNRGLSAVGVHRYVNHPSFRVVSLAYDLLDGHGVRRWVPPADLRPLALCEVSPPSDPRVTGDWGPYGDPRHPWPLLHYVLQNGALLEAHNASFERTVWEDYCVRAFGWPLISASQWRCSQAKARASAYPGKLANLGQVLQLPPHLQKDGNGDRLVKKLTVPRNPTKGNPELHWTPQTAPEDFEQFYRYNEQDVVAEHACSVRVPDLSPHELKIWQLDQSINRRGMCIDMKAVEDCIAIIDEATLRYNTELSRLTNGAATEATEVARILAWLHGRGLHLDALDDEHLTDALKRVDPASPEGRALRIRQMLSFGSAKKLYAMRAQTSADGRLRNQFAYHGAATGLWNGQGVQVSNLYRGRFEKLEEVERALSIIATRCLDAVEYEYGEGEALEVIASCLRSMIVAAPGHVLVSSDYSAIQAVVLAMLAGEQWRIDVFRTHGKIYETCASMITGKPLQFYLDYKKQHGAHHPDRQPYGKIAELSSGFGGWIGAWKRFGADEFMDDEQIKDALLKWRAASPSIVEMWGGQTRDRFTPGERPELYGLEGAAIEAVLHPGRAYDYRGASFQVHSDVLYCQTVSGGLLTYHAPRLQPSQRPVARPWEYELSYMAWVSNSQYGPPGWQRSDLYGGVLTQNVVSRVSRDIMANAMLRLDDAGYPIVHHCHDEITAEIRADGFGSLEEFERLMTPCEPWARDWPIAPKGGFVGPRYGKWG